MIRSMRASAKWIMGFVAVFFVGWMVFDVGLGVSGRAGYQSANAPIAVVNGVKIDQQTFYAAVRDAEEQQRRQNGNTPSSLELQRQLQDEVLNSLVQQVLLRQEYERRGIRVSNEEIVQEAQNDPPPEIVRAADFQTDGRFDLRKYQRFLASNTDPQFLLALEARYRQEIPERKLLESVTADVFVPDAKLWRMYRDVHDSLTATVLTLRPSSAIADTAVLVRDADIDQYYAQHKDDFNKPAVAFTSFVAVPRRLEPSDSAAALERVRALRAEIVHGGDFDAVARRESADSGSRVKGGDLGTVAWKTYVPEFDRAAKALKPGDISEPVLTQFGYHLLKIDKKTADSVHARHILIPVELAGAHLTMVEARGDSLDRFAADQTNPTVLDSVSKWLNVPLAHAPPVYKGDRVQLGRFVIPDVHIWAFDAQPGETSHVIETGQAFYVFRVDSLRVAGVAPLASIRDEVRAALIQARKADAAKALADKVAAQLKTGAKLAAVGQKFGLVVNTVGPFPRTNPPPGFQDAADVIGAGFGLKIGESSGPILQGRNVWFIEPVARKMADSTAFVAQIESQRLQVIQSARQGRAGMLLQALRAQAKVDDRRAALQEAQRKAAAQQPQQGLN
jgi:peptidyl-prolyl cis-trans isomerase D